MAQQSLRFTKMHGLGNDFVLIDAIRQSLNLQQLAISNLSNRHIGIGFDQLLILEPSQQADFFCRIFNADGSEAEQCGNGLRCLARYIKEERLTTQSSFAVETRAGIFPLVIEDDESIRVAMGTPCIDEKLITVNIENVDSPLSLSILSLGNPHAILKVESIDAISPEQLGPKISMLSYFPNGANVGFMQIINSGYIRLRTFERGIGETFACGSNACAAVVAGILNGWLKQQVTVEFLYGTLSVGWEGGVTPVIMGGGATRVFSGEIVLKPI